ncbi:MAG: TIGR03557 family F420-dependent LLM class oxidoreductase [Acidimicrobiia bacterium]|nr:TIGR03557 family F420-dependent LLM class oxidoreductase [Acidimicrobiia bacterium]MDH3396619.1 TIGR03557 family F420-dependent LLM class oxidoreductase [Acidimicrobiia bacterium]
MRGSATGPIAVSSDTDAEDSGDEEAVTEFAYFCGHEQWHPEQLVEHARLAEQAGFDMLVVSEHFHPWVDDSSAAGFAWSTIGAMAAVTNKVAFATGVTTPLWRYHPAVVAQAAATLDRLSAGRFNLGVGTGENINEGPLGFKFPGYTERAARMSEALQIMRRLLDGEKLTFGGDYYQTDRAKLYSPPLGPVPIWLAAGGPKSAALAARLADGIITSVKDPATTNERVLGPARKAADAVGRAAPRILATRWSVLAENEDEAWQALHPWRGLRAPGRLEAVDPADLRERADLLPREEVLGRYSIVSDSDQIVETYRPLIESCSADVVTLQMTSMNQESLIKMLGSEVLPRLRAIAA